jgi:tRNA A-37 threonylcarbamoyl transferase component Bud32
MNTRYQVKEPLASGGRGDVLRGWDSQLGREVAIKRVRRDVEGDNGSMIEDLVREARTLSTVQHPNVVTVYDAGSDDEGAFIVMELVKGETLETIVERGALTEGDFRSLVEQTLDGLLAAHQAGVIHLDLKPQNLMLTWLPGGGFQVKILDFGLAMATRQPVEQEMDDEGAIFGSIYFMAPEQFERVPVDVRTDLYALGCIFYFALTQRYPFNGELGLQVMTAHLQHKRVALERLRPDLSAFVTAWVEWLMSRLPEDRPESSGVALTAFRSQRMPEKAVRVEPAAVVVESSQEESGDLGKVKRELMTRAMATDQGRIQVAGGAGVRGQAAGKTAAVTGPGPATAAVSRWSRYTIPVLALLTVIAGVLYFVKKKQAETKLVRFAELVNAESLAPIREDVKLLLDYAADPDTSPAACLALSRMGVGAEVNGPILIAAKAAQGRIPTVNLLNVLALREINGGLEWAITRLGDADQEVAKAAWGVVGVMGTTTQIPSLLERCETLPQELDRFAESALVGIVQRAEDPNVAVAPVANAYQSGFGEARFRAMLVRVLGQSGGKDALDQLARAIQSGAVEVRRAAVSALALWPTNEPLELLASRFVVEDDAAARLMILRAGMALVMQPGKMSQEDMLVQVKRMVEGAKDRREKDQATAVAARVETPATLELLGELATKEPERAASIKGMAKRLAEVLEKVCVAKGGELVLASDRASFVPGRIEVKAGVLSGLADRGDSVSWLVKVDEAGRYGLQVNQAQQAEGAVVYDVLFAGQKLATKSVSTGGDKATFKAFEIGKVELTQPGHYRVILKVRQMPTGGADFLLKDLKLKRG